MAVLPTILETIEMEWAVQKCSHIVVGEAMRETMLYPSQYEMRVLTVQMSGDPMSRKATRSSVNLASSLNGKNFNDLKSIVKGK